MLKALEKFETVINVALLWMLALVVLLATIDLVCAANKLHRG